MMKLKNKIVSFTYKEYGHTKNDVNRACNDFSDILVTAAQKCVKIITNCKKSTKDRKKSKPGFDHECESLRKEIRSLGRAARRHPFDTNLRIKFHTLNKKYKNY